jgi:hypothetical protein
MLVIIEKTTGAEAKRLTFFQNLTQSREERRISRKAAKIAKLMSSLS